MWPDVVAAVMAPVLIHTHPVPLGDVPRLDHVVDGGGQTWDSDLQSSQTGILKTIKPDGDFPNSLTQPPSNFRGTRPSCEIISWDDKSILMKLSLNVKAVQSLVSSADEISWV